MNSSPKPSRHVVVTCGPASAPIDDVRRITNVSTGRLGITLANALVAAGHRVTCFLGEGSTCSQALRTRQVRRFLTNADLQAELRALAAESQVDVVFHAAALCDFEVARVVNPSGQRLRSRKVTSRGGRLTLELKPAVKVLPKIRRWFPEARIVGWKYEVEGGRSGALARGFDQLNTCRSAACVVNGAAYGSGFAFCLPDGTVTDLADLSALVRFLVRWVGTP
jgi:phosphopantothenoylcysteine decarboxylase/phosphopantothenate--cysteine ligase